MQEVEEVLRVTYQTGRAFFSIGKNGWNTLSKLLDKLAKNKVIARSSAAEYQNFTAETGSRQFLSEIPVNSEEAGYVKQLFDLQKELEGATTSKEKELIIKKIENCRNKIPEIQELKALDINFCVMPKIDESENVFCVAVDSRHKALFDMWKKKHLSKELIGGLHSEAEMKAFLEDQYTCFQMVLEGTDREAFELAMKEKGINVAYFYDRDLTDNVFNVAVANKDMKYFELYLKVHKENYLKSAKIEKEDVIAGQVISESDYMKTLTESDYYAQAAYEEVIRQEEEEFNQLASTVELDKLYGEYVPEYAASNCQEFVNLSKDSSYQMITIDKSTLVDSVYVQSLQDRLDQYSDSLFASYVPGTAHEELLLVPKDKVFTYNYGNSYAAFLPKNDEVLVLHHTDLNGNGIEDSMERWQAAQIMEYYDRQEQMINGAERLALIKAAEEAMEHSEELAEDLAEKVTDFLG